MDKIKYTKLTIFSLLLFIFLYTYNINFHLDVKFNTINFLIIIGVFILWVLYGYFFIIKDIIKASERERNGLVLLLVLLAIIFFYYNPFPKPEGSFIEIPRYLYFILTITITIISLTLARKQQFLGFLLAILIPISIQSFLINILFITKYGNFTIWLIMILVALAYFINYKKMKNK